jgi:hypothetical protein
MTMIISGSDGLEFPDGSDQGTAFTGNAATITSGTIATARLATGTANSSTYLRGDQTWAAVPAATPGGSTTQVQFNNAGAFGGDSGFVYTGGNVGIGTASPAVKLQVNGAVYANLRGNNAILLDSAGSYYGAIQNNSSDVWSLGYSGTAGTLGTPVLTWNGTGNVGIGTTSPSYKLDVQGASPRFWLKDTTASGSHFEVSADTSSVGIFNRSNLPMVFGTNNTARMRIDSSGRVGIGTASPSSLLDVNTSAAGNFVARITNNSGASSSDHALLVETSTASAAKIISARNAGVERFLVTGNGDVSVFNSFLMNSGYGSAATAYGCRAWVKFSGSSGSINGSGNVSSVSDNGTGNFTVNFSTAMPDTNYAWNGTCDPTSGQTSDGAVKVVFGRPDTNPTTSAIALLTCSSGAGRDDMESVFVTVHR